MKVKAVWHIGSERSERVIPFRDFLNEMVAGIDEMPSSALRQKIIRHCIEDVLNGERGEFGWTTYTLETEG